jgi:hypothetical protein
LLTGVREVSVDPDLAARMQLENFLENDHSAHKFTGYFQTGDDPQLDDVLHQLSEARANLKAKREKAKGLSVL